MIVPAGSVFLLNDTSSTGHPGCVHVVEAIRRNLEARGVRWAGSWPVSVDCRFASLLHAGVRNASAFIVNGEGTIHHTRNRPKARKLLLYAHALRRQTGRPVFLINASLEALEPEDFELLRSFDHVFVRDRSSRHYLGLNGVASDWVPDLCLAAEVPTYSDRQRILCTDSAVPSINPLLERCSTLLQARYARMRPGRWWSYWHYAFSDRSSLMAFASRYYEAIATAHGVVTGRFHAMLFCLLAGTPFVAITSNTRKIEAVLHDVFGSARRMVPPTSLAGARDIRIPSFTSAENRLRLSYVSVARQHAQLMFDDIVSRLYPA